MGTKRPSPESDHGSRKVARTTNYTRHVDRIAQVTDLEEKLKEKHSDKFSDVQYRAWANLVNMKKHNSLDKPPNLPFWRGTVKDSSSVSPGKRINLRGQCVDQLLKWHELLEKGAISTAQYDELKSTIMDDVKKF